MILNPDTQIVLRHTATLVNSTPGLGVNDAEGLPTVAALSDFFDDWHWTGARPRTRDDLGQVHRVRTGLHEFWLLAQDEGALVQRVNALLLEHQALPQLVRHDDLGWHIHATPPDAPFATRLAVEAAMALTDVIRTGQTDRLRVCIGQGCDSVLVDLSKNRSRKYCEGTCATRAHVAAYRARARENTS